MAGRKLIAFAIQATLVGLAMAAWGNYRWHQGFGAGGCLTNETAADGDCLRCFAANGEACRLRARKDR